MKRYSASLAVTPLGPVDATVRVPGSKSMTNRALLLAALAHGESRLTGCLFSDDSRYMLEALRSLGVDCRADESTGLICVVGRGGRFPKADIGISVGNAGTAMRFLTAACAVAGRNVTLDGNARMRQRPIGELITALRALGAELSATGDCPPVRVVGRSEVGLGGTCEFTDPQSSQYVSSVLMAAPLAARPVRVRVLGELVSEPYVAMTTAMMADFGVRVCRDGQTFAVPPGAYHGREYAIEPDASSASYPLAIAAVTGGRVRVAGLGTHSIQGDARFVDVLEKMGARVTRGVDFLEVRGPGDRYRLRGIEVNLSDMPDMAQTLAAVAMFAEGPTTIRGVGNLRIKETDRIEALRAELTKLGANVTVLADGLTVVPPPQITPAELDTYDDHRMAMSLAVVGTAAAGVVIREPGCVSKTYPDFFERLAELAGSVRRP